MAHIIAGHFQEQSQVDQVIEAIRDIGIRQEQISSFYVNPPGQHNLYSIGGDRDESPGAHDSSAGVVRGATTGGAIGAAAGLTGAPVFGPVGPAVGALVGAHIGGLIGSLSQMTEDKQPDESAIDVAKRNVEPHQRSSGLMVAVSVDDAAPSDTSGVGRNPQREIVDVLNRFGVRDLEEADGTIVDGDWQDFNPLAVPRLIDPATMRAI